MRQIRTTHIRMYPDTKLKLIELKHEVSRVQKKDIPLHEIARRIMNVPELKSIVVRDAQSKSRGAW